jgi:hypothetical protein
MEDNSKYFKSSKVRERSRDYHTSYIKPSRRGTNSDGMRKKTDSENSFNKNKHHSTHKRYSSSNSRKERRYNHRERYHVQVIH